MKELNIVEILKNSETEIKNLYSSTYGNVEVLEALENSVRVLPLIPEYDSTVCFAKDGHRFAGIGEMTLFPSKEMRSWRKLIWKKGDVLQKSNGALCMFKDWCDSNYSQFFARAFDNNGSFKNEDITLDTKDYFKVENEEVIQGFISSVEGNGNGKFNRQTLEFEESGQKFKDGDILTLSLISGNKYIFIYNGNSNQKTEFYVGVNNKGDVMHANSESEGPTYILCDEVDIKSLCLASDLERKQLFDALSKENDNKKSEFKDGDIVVVTEGSSFKVVCIVQSVPEKNKLFCHAYMIEEKICVNDWVSLEARRVKLATDADEYQLTRLLYKNGKQWDPDRKVLEDFGFKAFDRVLVRDALDEPWMPNLFSNYGENPNDDLYGCVSGSGNSVLYNKYCIPYNSRTAHLLGTRNDCYE